MIEQMPDFDPGLLRRALANHTSQDSYLLALIHGRGDRRYDLDSQPDGSVTPEERAEAARLLIASIQRGQDKAARVRVHREREEQRRPQRAVERRHRETRAACKAEYERQQQKIAARKAALAAQGVVVKSRVERQRRLACKVAARSEGQLHAEVPAVFAHRPSFPPPKPSAGPAARMPDRPEPAPDRPMPPVAFKKKRRVVPPPTGENND